MYSSPIFKVVASTSDEYGHLVFVEHVQYCRSIGAATTGCTCFTCSQLQEHAGQAAVYYWGSKASCDELMYHVRLR